MTDGLNGNGYKKYSLFIPSYSAWGQNTFVDGSYYTFTPKTTETLDVQIVIYSGQVMNNVKFYPKLQKGSVATKWSPYGYGTVEVISKNDNKQSSNICYVSTPLEKEDYIDFSEKKVKRTVTYDGTENWFMLTSSTYQNRKYFYTTDKIEAYIKTNSVIENDIFKLRDEVEDFSTEDWIALASNKNLCVYLKEATTLEQFKTYLAENPLKVTYERSVDLIDCSDKIVQYTDTTTVYNVDGAEIEVSLTNNKAISEVNENIKEVENKINTIDILAAELKADKSVTASTEKSTVVELQQAVKTGDKLSVTSDGGIKIGKGVKHVLVSANARLSSSVANKRVSIQPSRNLENVSSRFKHISANGFVCAAANKNYGNSISSTLIDAQENDVIYLQIYTEAGATYTFGKLFCNLTVQVVD